MKRAIILGIVAVLLLPWPMPARSEVTDRIVAIVNDDIVTLREVEKYVAVEKKSRYSSMNEYLRNMALREKLDTFIDNLLISQQAKKMKVEVGDKEVQATVDEMKKQNMIGDAELKEQLRMEHIDYKDFLDGIRLNITRNRVLARAVSQDVVIDEKILKAYYDSHLSDYVDEEFQIQHIFVSLKREDAAQRVRAAMAELDKDRSFGDVAKDYSDEPSKGEVGSVKKEDLLPELREALKVLMPGSYSPIVQTPYGYHILKLVDVNKGVAHPFEEVKDRVKEAIFQRESEKRYREYVDKLKSSSYIEVKI